MSIVRVTQDADTGYAYIYLSEPSRGSVERSVELERRDDDDPEAMAHLVLDFDREGLLLGIEVIGRAERWLRPELLRYAVRGSAEST
ncbi:DUF2283 domain-containing protein [Solirubrobacter taibaiensis]|nr:DUF2283 domain-containing protein [Solirubrobacter taibaiensis]